MITGASHPPKLCACNAKIAACTKQKLNEVSELSSNKGTIYCITVIHHYIPQEKNHISYHNVVNIAYKKQKLIKILQLYVTTITSEKKKM